ncbi:SCO3242 family prenyltransferase [Streptomyces sp. NPDC021212]|uniref:SCO3242 family prenyltransferase n=1 Tax=Streptomyces sp. NPDC021212 TaxID=3365118 RepID=UPI0037B8D23B
MTPPQGRAWAELLRISALFTVPGDAFAGAAATRTAPNRGTALAVGASLCLYEAGMALNDWADRDIDAVERPGRPLPSGRITPAAALTAATGLTGAGLVCAALAGRRALATAAALAGTVWAYDLGLKNTPAGPYAMATARSLDLLLGATATTPTRVRHALPPAALLGAHTLAVTAVSRHEATGGSSKTPLAALATATAIAWTATRTRPAEGPTAGARSTAMAMATAAAPRRGSPSSRAALRRLAAVAMGAASPGRAAATGPRPGPTAGLRAAADLRPGLTRALARRPAARRPDRAASPSPQAARPRPLIPAALAATYLGTAARPLAHAALNPSPHLLQRAVGGGIRAMIPLQAALAARVGSGRVGVGLLALAPVARRLSRKVSPT